MIPVTIQYKRFSESGQVKYYPQIAQTTPLSVTDICERIEQRSTVASADAKAVLDSLETTLREAILAGKSVRLGDLGSFRPTLRVKQTETEAAKVTADNVQGVRIIFTPSSALRSMLSLRNVSFKTVK